MIFVILKVSYSYVTLLLKCVENHYQLIKDSQLDLGFRFIYVLYFMHNLYTPQLQCTGMGVSQSLKLASESVHMNPSV